MKKELLSISKELKKLETKLDKLIKTVEKAEKGKLKATKKMAAKKKTAAKKTTGEPTAYATILSIIRRSRTGVNTAQLKAKTNYDDKKIANLIYKAKKQGKIASISKGVYKKA